MKLFLTSNGFMNTPLERDFQEMIGNHSDLKVAIIPTASNPIKWIPEKEGDTIKDYIAQLDDEKMDQYTKWLDSYRITWEKKGYSVTIADLKGEPIELKKKLESVDIIDVTGGDVNWLLDWAKKSQLDTYLKGILDRGTVYIGTSAGSGLVIPDIGLTWWDSDWKLDHIGLGIVDFIVVPHQKETDEHSNVENLISRRDYLQTKINFPWKIYLLQDGQAIKVIDDRIEHVGEGIKKCV